MLCHLFINFFFLFRFRKKNLAKASPWLTDINPRDANMPKDGDNGFFPTTDNDLASSLFLSFYIHLGGLSLLYIIDSYFNTKTRSRQFQSQISCPRSSGCSIKLCT